MKKMIAMAVCLVLFAISVFITGRQLRLMSTFGRPGSLEDDRNKKGMMCVRQELSSDMNSFKEFYEAVRIARPAILSNIDDPNPFSGILLSGHTYGRVLERPQGMLLDQVPLIWDAKPDSGGCIIVLLWDGMLAENMDERHFAEILDNVKMHGGHISFGASRVSRQEKPRLRGVSPEDNK